MFIRTVSKITLAILFLFSLAGCGSDSNSNTNGSLTLVADAPSSNGTALLNATATLAPAAGLGNQTPGLAGADVTFTATQFGYNSTTGLYETVGVYSETKPTNNAGAANIAHTFAQSQVMATNIQVTATCRGLTSQTINIPVPKFVP